MLQNRSVTVAARMFMVVAEADSYFICAKYSKRCGMPQ